MLHGFALDREHPIQSIMKFGRFVLFATLLVLMTVLFLWTRSPDSPVSKSPETEPKQSENPGLSLNPDEIEEGQLVDSLERSIDPVPQDHVVPSSLMSSGSPVPFESLSMSELEEVNFDNAGEQHSHKIREWKGRIEPSLSDLKDKLKSEGEEGVVAITLPDATQIQMTRMRYQSFGGNQGVITGKIIGDTFGEVILSYVNQAVAGSIHDYRNDAVWEIRNAGEGSQYIAQVDVNALGECGVCKAEHEE